MKENSSSTAYQMGYTSHGTHDRTVFPSLLGSSYLAPLARSSSAQSRSSQTYSRHFKLPADYVQRCVSVAVLKHHIYASHSNSRKDCLRD